MNIEIPDSCECVKPYDGDICDFCTWTTAKNLVRMSRDFSEYVELQKKIHRVG